MRVYFSGIGGVGIGPLAQIAHDAGYDVTGSDQATSLTAQSLQANGLTIHIGEQNGDYLRQQHDRDPLTYFVYTAALPADHPELVAARQLGITCLKRDGLIARIINHQNLQMVACAGTHGKTSTTGLMVWVMRQLGIPVSYSVGTTLSFGTSGAYDAASQYFVYECDEYDRNFLHYTPALSLISSIDYDHPDTYPSRQQYIEAFRAFIEQSSHTYLWQHDASVVDVGSIDSDVTVLDDSTALDHIRLPGAHSRRNAFLVERAIRELFPDVSYHELVAAINSFPGTDRRFEQLDTNLYSDYGHHPTEIQATLAAARELSDYVVLVYQPHQNARQHQVISDYTAEVFNDAAEIYWLPTYLSRENPELATLRPQQLTTQLPTDKLHFAELNSELWRDIEQHLEAGHLVLCMGAGSIDGWLRQQLTNPTTP